MAEESTGRERRLAQRYSCIGDAEIVVPGRGLRFRGKIGNLSATGCFIETECRLERGTSVEVSMVTQGLPLRVAANLLARRPGGVGLKFHSVSARRLEQIRELIGELEEAQKKPEQESAPAEEQTEPAHADVLVMPLRSQMEHRRSIFGTLFSVCTRAKRFAFGRLRKSS